MRTGHKLRRKHSIANEILKNACVGKENAGVLMVGEASKPAARKNGAVAPSGRRGKQEASERAFNPKRRVSGKGWVYTKLTVPVFPVIEDTVHTG